MSVTRIGLSCLVGLLSGLGTVHAQGPAAASGQPDVLPLYSPNGMDGPSPYAPSVAPAQSQAANAGSAVAVNEGPIPPATPGPVLLGQPASPWLVYPRSPCCCGPVGGKCSGPIGYEVFIRSGIAFPVGGGIFGNFLRPGWDIEGGGSLLLFNPQVDKAWTVNLGIGNIFNRTGNDNQAIDLFNVPVKTSINASGSIAGSSTSPGTSGAGTGTSTATGSTGSSGSSSGLGSSAVTGTNSGTASGTNPSGGAGGSNAGGSSTGTGTGAGSANGAGTGTTGGGTQTSGATGGTPVTVTIPHTRATVSSLNMTFVNIGAGREWWLLGSGDPGQQHGCNWRVGVDGGGRYGTAMVQFNELNHHTGVIGGMYAAIHTDIEYPWRCGILFGGIRYEYNYLWTSLLQSQNNGNYQSMNLLFQVGSRF